ncbi:MAG: NAD(P)/FAD-dependent oxidoreductase [Peptococcaceae bacterium]|jgi:phytoene dehydrogenase-like protein|nr:NAD(P)/FAD-dependent oxidoreductase [Peptococcaceae bacterium]
MSDAAFDAVVVGGGHHGTIIGCYLQKAGLSTAIFERQHELGGGACGEELPLPGFIQNPCAHFTRFFGHPAYKDFNLREFGLSYVFPDQNEGMVFDDGSSFVGYSAYKVTDPWTGKEEFSHENFQKTYEQIARFSKRDAGMYEEIARRYMKKWRAAFREYRYSPPTPWGVPNALEKLCDDPKDGIDPVYTVMTGKQVAYDLFESSQMRCLFMRAIETSTGSFPGDVLGLYVFVHTVGLVLSLESASIVSGGTHTITHALQRAFSSMGGRYFVESEVDKVIVENGAAVGIRLAGGATVRAGKLVVSDLGVPQTVFRLLGEEYLTPRMAHRVRNIDYDRAQIFWGNIAMHELPRYTAAQTNPDVGPQPRLYLGPNDPDYMAYKYEAEILTRGRPSKMFLLTAPDSIWDRNRAPGDKHTILVEEFTVPYRFLSEKEWLRLKKQIVNEILEQWRIYAPNMTRDNVMGAFITTPLDVTMRHPDMKEGGWVEGSMIPGQLDRFRPTPEFANYRTPVKNLYICSSNLHSGGGIGRGSSYNCFKVIATDFGLEKIWEKEGRPY